ncbi:MAG: DUF1569 domain-containing protein [Gemmatimonadota bacterium]|nr:DUF1569 domain-containing protein [Gemmatimonadota bacterium]
MRVAEIKQRLAKLRPDSERQWGTMTPAQVMAHCARGMKMATGELNLPRIFFGRLIGRPIGAMVFRDDKPFGRNAPTAKGLVIKEDPDFEAERARLLADIDRFVAVGAAGCTTHPHPFFGKMTSDQWAILAYKHLDHHLRQLGV